MSIPTVLTLLRSNNILINTPPPPHIPGVHVLILWALPIPIQEEEYTPLGPRPILCALLCRWLYVNTAAIVYTLLVSMLANLRCRVWMIFDFWPVMTINGPLQKIKFPLPFNLYTNCKEYPSFHLQILRLLAERYTHTATCKHKPSWLKTFPSSFSW